MDAAPSAPAFLSLVHNRAAEEAASRGPGAAFDKADRVRIRLMRGTEAAVDTTLVFAPGGVTQVRVAVELRDVQETLDLLLELLMGEQPLFTGSGVVTLEEGKTAAAEVSLLAQPAAVQVPDSMLRLDAVGETVQLQGATLFASGDTLPDASLTWSSLDPSVAEVSAAGLLHLKGYGTGRVVAALGTMRDTLQVHSFAVPEALVSAADRQACAITSTNALYCWGANHVGQSGNSALPQIGSSVPAAVDGQLGFRSVSAGRVTCGVATTNTAYCWGFNNVGQTGHGDVDSTWPHAEVTPRPVAGGLSFRTVSTNSSDWSGVDDHACGVTTQGDAFCWGSNSAGQLGSSSGGFSASPVLVAGGVKFRSISAGHRFTCGVSTMREGYCWGESGSGQLGNGSKSGASGPVRVAGDHRFAMIDTGRDHACGITTEGAVRCWGNNSGGQLGIGSWTGESTSPAPVAGALSFVSVSAGSGFSCGVTPAGVGYCWGGNHLGRLGVGADNSLNVPSRVAGSSTFTAISAGSAHACGVTTNGAVYCWGDQLAGGLGDGNYGYNTVPTAGPGGTFRSIAVGALHSCGLNSSGSASCWGLNWDGQLGGGTYSVGAASPVAVTGAPTFTSITVGSRHTCALTASGSAQCWGNNSYLQLGSSSVAGQNRSTPVAVSGGHAFVQIDAGWYHSCALTGDGSAYCWGANQFGQLGDGTLNSTADPVRVAGGLRFSSIAAGVVHTCGVTTSGAAFCWGSNEDGQLGDGTRTNRATPVAVAGGLTFSSVDAGGNEWDRRSITCGITVGGAAYCWGPEWGCRLGNGSCEAEVVHSTPVPVLGGLNFSSLTVSSSGACGIATNGQTYCWGGNLHGQLGTGHTGEPVNSPKIDSGSPIPVAVTGSHSFSSVQVSHENTCGLTTGGAVYCWGPRGWGGQGNGSVQYVNAPKPISGGIFR